MDHQHWRRRRCTLIKVVHLHTTQIMPLGSEGIKRLPGHFEIGEKRIKLRCPAGLKCWTMGSPGSKWQWFLGVCGALLSHRTRCLYSSLQAGGGYYDRVELAPTLCQMHRFVWEGRAL